MSLPHKQYHCNLVYNVKMHGAQDDSDYKLSFDFVKYLAKELESSQIKCFFYDRDAIPGESVFDEFFRGVQTSVWTIIIFTRGFSSHGWARYCQQAALYDHIVKQSGNKVIPLLVDNETLPKEFCHSIPISFDKSWNEPGRHIDEISKLRKTLLPDGTQSLVSPTLLDLGTREDPCNRDPVQEEIPCSRDPVQEEIPCSRDPVQEVGSVPSVNADATSYISSRQCSETSTWNTLHNQSIALPYAQYPPSPNLIPGASLINSLTEDCDLSFDSTIPKEREEQPNGEGINNETEQSNLDHQEENITHELVPGKKVKLTEEDKGQPGILFTAKNQDQEEQVRGERSIQDDCVKDAFEPNSTARPGRRNSAVTVGSVIFKLVINVFTRTD